MISKFLWSGKRARIKSTTLQCPKLEGGLALPNLKFYHLAFQVRALRNWADENSMVPWRVIEKALAVPHRLQDLLYIKHKHRKLNERFGNIISYSLLVWSKVEKLLGDVPQYHTLSPLWNNPLILTAGKPFIFIPWASRGINTLGNIYDDNGLLSFQQLQQRFDIPGSSFFLYLRLRSSLMACGVKCDAQIDSHFLSGWFNYSQCARGWVTKIYNALINSLSKTVPIEGIWDRELNKTGSQPDWHRIWSNINNTSRNLSHQLINFKVIHRLYATPYKRYRMGLLSTPNCTLCQSSSVGTVSHMFWECAKVNTLWIHVCDIMGNLEYSTARLNRAKPQTVSDWGYLVLELNMFLRGL